MKKIQLSSLILGLGLIGSMGLGVVHTQTSSTATNVKNVRLLVNSRHACVINGNGDLSLTNANGQVIGYVSVGEMLTLGQSSNEKTFVTVQETGETGYLANSNIKNITSAVGENLVKTNRKGSVINVSTILHVRANATMDSQVLTNLTNNTNLTITGKVGNWYQVNVNGVEGYIFDEYIAEGSINQNNTITNSNKIKETSTSKENETVSNKENKTVSNNTDVLNNNNPTIQKSNSSDKKTTQSNTIKAQHKSVTNTSKKASSNTNNNSNTIEGNGIVKKLGTGYYHAKLHSAPSSSSSGYDLTPGTQVQILGEVNEFYHVRLTNGDLGYIYAPYVERTN